MSRTPLMNALQRISADHVLADRTGTDVDHVREQRANAASALAQRGISRRTVLKASAAAGAGAMLAGGLIRPSSAYAAGPRKTTEVAVVGGGMAGLNAALFLKDKGFQKVTVYEANPSRLGGRVWTDRSGFWANGQHVEWGGELIDSSHTTIFGLASRFGLAMYDTLTEPGEDIFYFSNGYYTSASIDADFKAMYPAMKADMASFTWPITYNAANSAAGVALSRMSVYDWIRTRVPGGNASRMGKLLDVAYNIEFGAETRDQSALNLLGLLGYQKKQDGFAVFGPSDERYKIVGGVDQLVTGMVNTIGTSNIRTGYTFQQLRANNDGTSTLTFLDGASAKTVVADYVIMALPVAIMKQLSYSGAFGAGAGFDPRKDALYRAFPTGNSVKLHAQFNKRIWRQSGPWGAPTTGGGFSDRGHQSYWEPTRGQTQAVNSPGILVDYTGGNPAAAQIAKLTNPFSTSADGGGAGLQVAGLAKTFLSQIEKEMPGLTKNWNGRASAAAWAKNPYSLGAYSYWNQGYADQFSGYEVVPERNVHFAGEYCSIDFQGYIEGAAQEGLRAAKEVLVAVRAANGAISDAELASAPAVA